MSLNIVIPMAGEGRRFVQAGYDMPKPLIPIQGTPMIRCVIENLRPARPHRFIVICQRAHVRAHRLDEKLAQWAPGCVLVEVDGTTQGAACTVLAAKHLIDGDEPLMIANSDQLIDVPIDDYLAAGDARQLQGLLMTMRAHDPKWSFARLGEANLVEEVAEKRPISDEATVGIYNFAHGGDFVRAALAMIERDLRVNGEFYVAPVYNELIAQGHRIGVHNVGTEGAGMHGLGTPDDLERFLALLPSRKGIRVA
ncbi:MAG: glycosyltransferase family 2 protein [Rhizobacter sp.]